MGQILQVKLFFSSSLVGFWVFCWSYPSLQSCFAAFEEIGIQWFLWGETEEMEWMIQNIRVKHHLFLHS